MSHYREKLASGGDTDVIGLYDAETDMSIIVAMLENTAVLGKGFVHKIEQLEDKDWEREWMDNFHPMRFWRTFMDLLAQAGVKCLILTL